MEYLVKTKEKCVYKNVLYTAGEEFIFQAENKSDLPDYVQVVSEIADSNSSSAETGTEESAETGTETKQTATFETKAPAKDNNKTKGTKKK